MRRLGSEPVLPPIFFLEKIEKVKQNLEVEQTLLENIKREAVAREERTNFPQNILDQACSGDLEVLIGFNNRIPALPPRPARKRFTRQSHAAPTDPYRSGRKRKRSLSRAPPKGSARSAYGGPETSGLPESSGVDRSRRIQQRWPRSTSQPRRRSVSRAPSTARVHQEEKFRISCASWTMISSVQ